MIDTPIEQALRAATYIQDIGCGTGELAFLVSGYFNKCILGFDHSEVAIDWANSHYHTSLCQYEVWDFVEMKRLPYHCDVAIVSHVLEHFADPYSHIDRFLDRCKQLIIIVPYNDTEIATNRPEGGIKHKFIFTKEVLARYNIVCEFHYQTEMARRYHQWVVMIE